MYNILTIKPSVRAPVYAQTLSISKLCIDLLLRSVVTLYEIFQLLPIAGIAWKYLTSSRDMDICRKTKKRDKSNPLSIKRGRKINLTRSLNIKSHKTKMK